MIPYFLKALFYTLSYLTLLTQINNKNTFLLAVGIFAGSILFDLFFSYRASLELIQDRTAKNIRFFVLAIASVFVLILFVSISGMADIFDIVTESDNNIKYITFGKSIDFVNTIGVSIDFKLKLSTFFHFLLLGILSSAPDIIIYYKKNKQKNKLIIKQIKQRGC